MTVVEVGSLNSRPELEVVPRATLDDFDPELLYQWLSVYKHSVFGSLSSFTDEEVLLNRRAIAEDSEGVGSKFSPQRRYRLAGAQGPVDVSVGATFSKGA